MNKNKWKKNIQNIQFNKNLLPLYITYYDSFQKDDIVISKQIYKLLDEYTINDLDWIQLKNKKIVLRENNRVLSCFNNCLKCSFDNCSLIIIKKLNGDEII